MASRPEPPATAPIIIQRAPAPDPSGLAALLQFEAEVRRQGSEAELRYLVANETRKLVPYDQLFVLRHARIGDGWHVVTASSLATVDRNAPLIHAIEKIMVAVEREATLAAARDFDPRAFIAADDATIAEYPFHHWRWQPLMDADDKPFAGLLIARTAPLREAETVRLDRIAETVGHGWRALSGCRPVRRIRKMERRERIALAIVAAGIVLLPVQMTALAPVEVVAARPFVIAAPFAGVVATIAVPPNAPVRTGQLLLTFEDVKLRNELALAAEKLGVARARMDRSASAAFGAAEEAREIAINRAELDLASAEYDYARDLLAKSRLAAPRDGIAIYSDRRDWEGRAVNVGEAILQVADPSAIEFRAELPAREQLTLVAGDRVRVWLDAQPLWAIDARLERASYQARETPEGVLAFTVSAKPIGGSTPRIGSRGTAKIYGRWVPLSYALLRRPIASLRQTIGF